MAFSFIGNISRAGSVVIPTRLPLQRSYEESVFDFRQLHYDDAALISRFLLACRLSEATISKISAACYSRTRNRTNDLALRRELPILHARVIEARAPGFLKPTMCMAIFD